jgi:hypothetical protein
MRGDFGMLNSMLMQGNASTNANRSSFADTDKYTRLADAFNSQLLYKPGVASIDNGGMASASEWIKNPANLTTQDTKQADLMRRTQEKLSAHQLSQESLYNQDLLRRKQDEMALLVNKSYADQFFGSEEAKKRDSSQFQMWQDMVKQEYTARLNNIDIPYEQAQIMANNARYGDYLTASAFAEKIGITAPSTQQLVSIAAQQQIVKQFFAGEITVESANAAFGQLQGDVLFGTLSGMVQAGLASKDTLIHDAADTLKQAVGDIVNTADWVANNAVIAVLGASVGALLAWIASEGVDVLKALASNPAVVKAATGGAP